MRPGVVCKAKLQYTLYKPWDGLLVADESRHPWPMNADATGDSILIRFVTPTSQSAMCHCRAEETNAGVRVGGAG